jgi:3-dehydroquinate synthetase
VKKVLQHLNLPTELKEPLPLFQLMAAMQRDKKNRSGRIRLITMKQLGHAITCEGVENEIIEQLWREIGAY